MRLHQWTISILLIGLMISYGFAIYTDYSTDAIPYEYNFWDKGFYFWDKLMFVLFAYGVKRNAPVQLIKYWKTLIYFLWIRLGWEQVYFLFQDVISKKTCDMVILGFFILTLGIYAINYKKQ